jgi:hypothetical protein
MGTNYYLVGKTCPTCGHEDGRLHIGKSSGGWCFSLHVIPEESLNTLEDWVALFSAPNATIADEYGNRVAPDGMLRIITERHLDTDFDAPYKPDGWYTSWEKFHAANSSEPGPNGLLRATMDGRHCVGHGEGTWDYITGEFS